MRLLPDLECDFGVIMMNGDTTPAKLLLVVDS